LAVMRGLTVVLVVAAVATAVLTAALILRLPAPPVAGDDNFGAEALHGVYTEQNAEKRNEYLAAGGFVVVTLLGAAVLIARRKK